MTIQGHGMVVREVRGKSSCPCLLLLWAAGKVVSLLVPPTNADPVDRCWQSSIGPNLDNFDTIWCFAKVQRYFIWATDKVVILLESINAPCFWWWRQLTSADRPLSYFYRLSLWQQASMKLDIGHLEDALAYQKLRIKKVWAQNNKIHPYDHRISLDTRTKNQASEGSWSYLSESISHHIVHVNRNWHYQVKYAVHLCAEFLTEV